MLKFFLIEKKSYFCGSKRVFYTNIMKKVILTLAFILSLGCKGGVHAQDRATDGFFKSDYELYREENLEWGVMPLLPRTHGYLYDYSAEPTEEDVPAGSGLLLLGSFGLAYLSLKKKD